VASNKLHKLSAYRLEVNAVDNLAFKGFDLFADGTVTIEKESIDYRLLFLKGRAKPASWYDAFSHLNADKTKIPKTLNPGFILLVKVANAYYAVTGGVGHSHLRKHVDVTYQFGVALAKRILSEEELRSLAQRDTGGNVNAIDRHFRGRYSPRNDINNLRRILKNVRGKLSKAKNPLVKKIGSSIQGTDALTVNGAKTFDDIFAFLVAVEELWQKGKERITIPSLVQLDKKAHATRIASLKTTLIDDLVSYKPDDPQLLFLEGESRDVFNDETTKWTLHAGKWKQDAHSASEVFEIVRDRLAPITTPQKRLEAFEALELRIEYDDGMEEDDVLFRFICGDVIDSNENYFLDHRAWFHASSAYIKTLTAQLDNVECIDSATLGLNEWDKATYVDEDKFNASHNNFVLLDRRLVKHNGETGIEFCDLFGPNGAKTCLIHVKEANGAELRALFAQGSVSGTLYSEESAFKDIVHACGFTSRNGVAALTAANKQLLADLKTKQIRELTVVYAVLDTTKSHAVVPGATLTSQVFDGTLSTFAKVDLLNHCQTLRGMGYGVALTRIRPHPVPPAKKAAKKRDRSGSRANARLRPGRHTPPESATPPTWA
jgi:uncharacterized protein (TIGR04141 family)